MRDVTRTHIRRQFKHLGLNYSYKYNFEDAPIQLHSYSGSDHMAAAMTYCCCVVSAGRGPREQLAHAAGERHGGAAESNAAVDRLPSRARRRRRRT